MQELMACLEFYFWERNGFSGGRSEFGQIKASRKCVPGARDGSVWQSVGEKNIR